MVFFCAVLLVITHYSFGLHSFLVVFVFFVISSSSSSSSFLLSRLSLPTTSEYASLVDPTYCYIICVPRTEWKSVVGPSAEVGCSRAPHHVSAREQLSMTRPAALPAAAALAAAAAQPVRAARSPPDRMHLTRLVRGSARSHKRHSPASDPPP